MKKKQTQGLESAGKRALATIICDMSIWEPLDIHPRSKAKKISETKSDDVVCHYCCLTVTKPSVACRICRTAYHQGCLDHSKGLCRYCQKEFKSIDKMPFQKRNSLQLPFTLPLTSLEPDSLEIRAFEEEIRQL